MIPKLDREALTVSLGVHRRLQLRRNALEILNPPVVLGRHRKENESDYA